MLTFSSSARELGKTQTTRSGNINLLGVGVIHLGVEGVTVRVGKASIRVMARVAIRSGTESSLGQVQVGCDQVRDRVKLRSIIDLLG